MSIVDAFLFFNLHQTLLLRLSDRKKQEEEEKRESKCCWSWVHPILILCVHCDIKGAILVTFCWFCGTVLDLFNTSMGCVLFLTSVSDHCIGYWSRGIVRSRSSVTPGFFFHTVWVFLAYDCTLCGFLIAYSVEFSLQRSTHTRIFQQKGTVVGSSWYLIGACIPSNAGVMSENCHRSEADNGRKGLCQSWRRWGLEVWLKCDDKLWSMKWHRRMVADTHTRPVCQIQPKLRKWDCSVILNYWMAHLHLSFGVSRFKLHNVTQHDSWNTSNTSSPRWLKMTWMTQEDVRCL